jgi:hypothetical protein
MNSTKPGPQRIRRVPAWSTGDPALSRPLAERAGWTDADAARESIHDAEHGARPRGRPPATFAPGSGGTADRPA